MDEAGDDVVERAAGRLEQHGDVAERLLGLLLDGLAQLARSRGRPALAREQHPVAELQARRVGPAGAGAAGEVMTIGSFVLLDD